MAGACKLSNGTNVTITGTGSTPDPYVINSAAGGGGVGVLTDIDTKTRSAGNITVNGTAYADIDNTLDIVLTAEAGDTIEVGASGRWNNNAVSAFMDVATIVAGVPVTYLSGNTSTGDGIQAWYGFASTDSNIAGGLVYVLAAGDISAGTVTLRLRARTNPAGNRILIADTAGRFKWFAVNYGVVPAGGVDVPVAREGGSATDWTTAGGTTQTIPAGKGRIQVGSQVFSGIGANASASLPVTFPIAFAQKPLVFVSLDSPTGDGRLAGRSETITATGCNIILQNYNVGNPVGGTVFWMAVGEVA